MNKVLKENL